MNIINKIKNHQGLSFLSMTLVLSLHIFLVNICSLSISAVIILLLAQSGYFQDRPEPSLAGALLFIAILSTVSGIILSSFISNLPLRPIRKVIAATNDLANGNFDARIHISFPHELKNLADSFNRMAEELGSVEILRSDFVNNFSHEFKTPIVSLRGFAKLLKDESLTPAERVEYLDIIIQESDRLASLATNVLNLSKIESQKILTEHHPFNLSEQIRRCILLLTNKWEDKKLELDINIEEFTYNGSPELLEQVWLNLIDNAIKFSPSCADLRIDLFGRDNNLVFQIRNWGEPLDGRTLAHIFDKFYQADQSHSTAGNGLGLTLSEKIIQLHGGSIQVSSTEAEGTVFTLFLPLPGETQLPDSSVGPTAKIQ